MAERKGPEADEARAPRRRLITRRRAAIGAGALLTASTLEYFSFRGSFDHRYMVARGRDRFDASLAALNAARERGERENGVLHIGHSTHCLVVDGVRFLTDPWFYDPAFGAMKHESGPAVEPARFEGLDAILITHDHADHCDEKALAEMPKSGVTCVVATKELVAKVKRCGFSEAEVLAPWETLEVDGVRVTAVPGLHDIYEIGFVLEGKDGAIYFAGDSALHPDLKTIAERFSPKLSILPVDGTRIRGADLHVMRPVDAVEAAKILGSPMLLPSHAEAIFHDPIAKYLITENIEGANLIFDRLMRESLPDRKVLLPAPGDWAQIG
jgi:L-ascorbate metabolism protein UlaG (beta-lactamase superfamily)